MTSCFNIEPSDECGKWQVGTEPNTVIKIWCIYLLKFYLPTDNNTNLAKMKDRPIAFTV